MGIRLAALKSLLEADGVWEKVKYHYSGAGEFPIGNAIIYKRCKSEELVSAMWLAIRRDDDVSVFPDVDESYQQGGLMEFKHLLDEVP